MRCITILPRQFGKTTLCKEIIESELKNGKSVLFNYHYIGDNTHFIQTINESDRLICCRYSDKNQLSGRFPYIDKKIKKTLVCDDFFGYNSINLKEYIFLSMNLFDDIFITSSAYMLQDLQILDLLKKNGFDVIEYNKFSTEDLIDLFDKGIEIV